ncbi:MAG TPA: hypothetical protein PLH07_05105 [Sulfurovum sp.]|nr:hypothetical protein [Sulfurovum sp.]HQS72514.1 hypothetical protein [Sulfurovum sp.]HQS78280.1 hypothetical protein [Sulfurovum sp.]HQT28658.1 hypothetical protein [Sulfurovum sp.]
MKNNINKLVVVAIVVLMTACSQKADSIKATYVSPLPYEKHSCEQLKGEVIRVNKRLAEISGQQADVANKDAVVVGVSVVFWPAILLMALGEDQKAEVGNLKGQYNTLRDVAVKKNCDFAASMK